MAKNYRRRLTIDMLRKLNIELDRSVVRTSIDYGTDTVSVTILFTPFKTRFVIDWYKFEQTLPKYRHLLLVVLNFR